MANMHINLSRAAGRLFTFFLVTSIVSFSARAQEARNGTLGAQSSSSIAISVSVKPQILAPPAAEEGKPHQSTKCGFVRLRSGNATVRELGGVPKVYDPQTFCRERRSILLKMQSPENAGSSRTVILAAE